MTDRREAAIVGAVVIRKVERTLPHMDAFWGQILAFFIATVIGLIVVMDRPLRGPHGISADPFLTVYQSVMENPAFQAAGR